MTYRDTTIDPSVTPVGAVESLVFWAISNQNLPWAPNTTCPHVFTHHIEVLITMSPRNSTADSSFFRPLGHANCTIRPRYSRLKLCIL